MSSPDYRHSPIPGSPSTITQDKLDYGDTHSMRSLDLEEAKAMLRDAPEQEALFENQPRSRLRKYLGLGSYILNAVLFIAILVLLSNPCAYSGRNCIYQPKGLSLLGEVNGFVPDFDLEKVTFMNDSSYGHENMFDNEQELQKVLHTWENDMPIGRGFVKLPIEATEVLPRPFRLRANPNANGYSIASFHQFHCIWMIMRGYGHAKFNTIDSNPDALRHVTHCFDYLRQSVLCAGDSAMEGRSSLVPHLTDGWGNVHVCKKLKSQVNWIHENRFSDYRGIH